MIEIKTNTGGRKSATQRVSFQTAKDIVMKFMEDSGESLEISVSYEGDLNNADRMILRANK